jgi:hypothetical protein
VPSSATASGTRRPAASTARRTETVIWRVQPRSAAKIAFVVSASLWLALLVAGVVLWLLASISGLLGNVENFWTEATGQEAVSWNGPVLFASSVAIAVVMVVVGTAGAWLAARLFNAASSLTGGLVAETE